MNRSAPTISVVVPVYNCADCLESLSSRLLAALDDLNLTSEVVFVDDRSPDCAWRTISELAQRDPRVVGVRLSRNFGQHVAVTAGVEHSSGEWIVVMDCDLQDRPEDLPRLWAKAAEGHELVFTRRRARRQSPIRRLGARLYFRTRNFLLKTEFETEVGSFLMFSRKVANAFLEIRDKDRPHGLVLAWLGFDPVFVEVEHDQRHSGRSSYTLPKLVASAVNGLFFQTTILLRWIVYLGFGVALCGFALAAVLVVFYAFVNPPPGWTSVAVLILLIGGVTITSLGVSALYVGKIFDQVKERPLYVVDRLLANGVEATPVMGAGRDALSREEVEA
jgi:glycosyltransferase involved in cell wall biosynthesis